MNDLESAEKIAIDIEKLERNLKQVAHITFEGSEKEVYDRAIDYKNDSKYYLEKEDYVFGVSNSLLLTPDLTKAKIFENEEDIPDLNLMNVKIEKLFLRLKTNSLESEDFDLPKINIQENNKKESVSSFDDEKWEKIDNLDEDKTDEGFKITGELFGGNQNYGDQSDDEDE